MDAIARIENGLKGRFGADIKGFASPSPTRLFVDVDRRALRAVARRCSSSSAAGTWSASATTRSPATARSGSSTPSLSTPTTSRSSSGPPPRLRTRRSIRSRPIFPNAGWSEREYQDLLGMTFTGHPKPKRLILADDWPDGIYPLRKEVPYNLDAAGRRGRRLPARRGPAGDDDRPRRARSTSASTSRSTSPSTSTAKRSRAATTAAS